MQNRKLMIPLSCLFALLLPAAGANTGDAPPPHPAVQRLQTAIASRPGDATLRYFLAVRLAALGDEAGALRELRQALALQDGLLPLAAEHFPKLQAQPSFQALRAEFEASLPRELDRVRGRIELPERELLPEGIAHDPRTGHSYLGSMKQGRVLRVDADGRAQGFLAGGPAALLGVAVDAQARRLHVVRSNGFLRHEGQRINRVESYALDDGRLLASTALPEAIGLNEVCLGAAGELFVSDSMGGRVWRLAADGSARPFGPPLRGANGLAFDAHRGALFVAHSGGIARLALDGDDALLELALPPRQQAASVDGLYLLPDGDLVGIQNMNTPGRVLRLDLDAEGRRATRLRTLLSHHHADLREPTTAALIDGGRRLRLLASTQASRLQADGSVRAPESLHAPVLLDLDLAAD